MLYLLGFKCACLVAIFDQFIADAIFLNFMDWQVLGGLEMVDADREKEIIFQQFSGILDFIL